VGGVVQLRASDLGKAVGAQVLWKNSSWALIRLESGIVRGTFTAPWQKLDTATVRDALVSGKTYTVMNYFSSISGSSDKRCAIAQVGGEWILIAAEC
jgi:hypothetical protein